LAEATRLNHQEKKLKSMLNHSRQKQNNNSMLNHPWKKLKQCLITMDRSLHQQNKRIKKFVFNEDFSQTLCEPTTIKA